VNITAEQSSRSILAMAEQLAKLTSDDDPVMLGIRTGGVLVADKLQETLQLSLPPGALNISFYRDDFSRIGLHPRVGPSEIPFDIDSRTVILADDVLYSGRTIRAAMNEIFDYGRPDRIILAVLIERRGRELPIQADVVGQRIDIAADQNIKLLPDLSFEVQSKPVY